LENVPPFQNYYIIAIFGLWVYHRFIYVEFPLGLKMTCIAAGRLLQQPGWILSGFGGGREATPRLDRMFWPFFSWQ